MLWSQDRTYQWANYAEPASGHHGGGYGYLRAGDRTISTLYADRPEGAQTERLFGSGYFGRRTAVDGVDVSEEVYAPFGDDPLLLHDVTIRNTSAERAAGDVVRVLGRQPVPPGVADAPRPDGAGLRRGASGSSPSASCPRGATPTRCTSSRRRSTRRSTGGRPMRRAFFGAGGRANPDAVAADRLTAAIALPVPTGATGTTLFAFRSPVVVAPGQSRDAALRVRRRRTTSRSPALVERWRAAATRSSTASARGATGCRAARFEGDRRWLQRELQWDAYMLRSGMTYEEACGHHILSQGGYYQYENGHQIAYRDPLQHILPLIYAEPEIARETIRYSAKEQPLVGGLIPYGMTDMCTRLDFGSSNDLDLWLHADAAEYGLASRDPRSSTR